MPEDDAGHSNPSGFGQLAFPDPDTSKARVPISGGATLEEVHRLPDLYLSREEWEQIGRDMGWLNPGRDD